MEQDQTKKGCWHLYYCEDEGDSMHPKVVEVAYKLNRLIIAMIQKPEEFNYSDISSLLNSEIKYMKNHYDNSEQILRDVVFQVVSGPTSYFSSTRSSFFTSMGISEEDDIEILNNVVNMECSEDALTNVFLFRGSRFEKDKPYNLEKQEDPLSLSFGTSLFAGVVYDPNGSAFH